MIGLAATRESAAINRTGHTRGDICKITYQVLQCGIILVVAERLQHEPHALSSNNQAVCLIACSKQHNKRQDKRYNTQYIKRYGKTYPCFLVSAISFSRRSFLTMTGV